MITLAKILAGFGCLLLIVGSLGLMDGDPTGLIFWMPGALLMILGLAIGYGAKSKK